MQTCVKYRGTKSTEDSGRLYMATEGIGLYVTPTKLLARSFGTVHKVIHNPYQSPLVVKAGYPYALTFGYRDICGTMLKLNETVSVNDSDWDIYNKNAWQKVKNCYASIPVNVLKERFIRSLSVVLRNKHDSVIIDTLKDYPYRWEVILDTSLVVEYYPISKQPSYTKALLERSGGSITVT